MTQLDAILTAVGIAPALPGARCRGRHALFDERRPDEAPDVADARHNQAVGLCGHCPSLNRCATWLAGLPKTKRPSGVVAGKVRQANPVGRPKSHGPVCGRPNGKGRPCRLHVDNPGQPCQWHTDRPPNPVEQSKGTTP